MVDATSSSARIHVESSLARTPLDTIFLLQSFPGSVTRMWEVIHMIVFECSTSTPHEIKTNSIQRDPGSMKPSHLLAVA